MSSVRLEIRVKGRVQGVFFRQCTQITARRLGIKGYVRNTPDGDVQIFAHGDEKSMNEFVEWCHSGSPGSLVREVITKPDTSQEAFKDFNIRYRG